MLYLIGLGLDKNDVSLNALKAIKDCKMIYWETYTNVYNYSQKEIEKTIGKKVIPSDRKAVEEGKDILESAKKQKTALLVSGDPLSATTHFDIVLRCRKQNIKFEIIHAVSVFNAVAETGLQLYKFGKTTSIPKWQKSYQPESFYDVIKQNLSIDAHTLLLIDIGLDVSEALSYIKQIAEKRKDKSITRRKLIVGSRLGTFEAKVYLDSIDKLMKEKIKVPACIIIPAELHFIEAEALERVKE